MDFNKETTLQFLVYILLALLIWTNISACSDKRFYENDVIEVAEKKYNELLYDYAILYDSLEKLDKHSQVFDRIQEPSRYDGALTEEIFNEIDRKQSKEDYERGRS